MNAARRRHEEERSFLLATALGSILTMGGCAPEGDDADDGVVETAHLRISNSTGNPICAGTPLLLESELARIAEALELPLWAEDDPLVVRFGSDAVAVECESLFGDEAARANGCVTGASGELVLAAVDVVQPALHELAHAVRAKNSLWSAIVFEEGLAEVLSGSDGFPRYVVYPRGEPYTGPVELLELPRAEFESRFYIPSESFVSWLWEAHGRSTLMGFMNDPALADEDAVLALFEAHFGHSLAQAEQQWRVDERPEPVWGAPCIPERTYSLADGPLELSGGLDCSEPTVYGAAYYMSLWPMCLEIPETTRVRISFDAGHGELQLLLLEGCNGAPASAEAWQSKRVDAGESIEADMVGCRFRMLLHSAEPGFPATPYTIRIEEIAPS
jgi:hypothetical protein